MIDQIFQNRPKKHVRDLNIVPILDMLTTVIFFLLMSTSFMEFTKLTVPPSSTSSVSVSDAPPPLSPKMFLVRAGEGYSLSLRWGGKRAGEAVEKLKEQDPQKLREELFNASRKLATDFQEKNPTEKTLQVALAPLVPYQMLISMMDGVQEKMPDVVLISYREAERQ